MDEGLYKVTPTPELVPGVFTTRRRAAISIATYLAQNARKALYQKLPPREKNGG
jgi:hypothetical protein